MNNWYTTIRKEIEAQYGDDADLFCDLLAATSPRKQVGANWKLAARIYGAWTRYRGHSMNDRIWYSALVPGLMTSQRPNVIRALKREELSGPKVKAFAANLKGDLSQVTVDVWMLRLFDYDKPTEKHRKEVVDFVIRAAEEMGCEPAEMQAEMWQYSIRTAGREPKTYLATAVKQRQLEFWPKD